MAQTDRILKVDATGRVWTPREEREAALEEFARSGMPATKFAALAGINYQTKAVVRKAVHRAPLDSFCDLTCGIILVDSAVIVAERTDETT